MNDVMMELPGYLLRRASAASISDLSGQLASLNLTTTEVGILLLIAANAGITQSSLCRALGIQRANMTPLISRLEARGLVIKRAVDGRSQQLTLTSDGAALYARALDLITAYENGLIAKVPKALRPHVVPILKALWEEPAAEIRARRS